MEECRACAHNDIEADMRAKLLLHELKLTVSTEAEDRKSINFKAMARSLVAVVRTQHHVDTTAPSDVPFGLTSETVRDTWGLNDTEQMSMMKEAMRVLLPPEVEAGLRAKCELLCDTFYPLNSHTPLPASQLHRLPQELAAFQADVTAMEAKRDVLEAAVEGGLEEHIRLLTDMTKHIVSMIKYYRLDDVTIYSRLKMEFVQSCVAAMQKQIELLTTQLLLQTYPPHKLRSLAQLRLHLDQRYRMASQRNWEMRKELDKYRTSTSKDLRLLHERIATAQAKLNLGARHNIPLHPSQHEVDN
ncbi:hypothetical protein, variant 1 [Aphanomyces astaci]|uniref:Uncharacterized protein n=1 Tax=Aphanomyces astaci TaxID=112090 RepID=W4G293_APHAT|nr:hypothetical protein, variant 1 [Aphanomyces astaci]ETV73800.1 hypothetical protein, variant 1 [Aphanomyces astaci]|eukprot:XP_009836735.1 hypothetical protein, variant 1 [Aphanomyces astaci]